jgi:Conserved TM helix
MWEQIRQALAQATEGFLTRLATVLPGLAALIVAVLISCILAIVLAIAVRRLLTSLHFEERLARSGLSSLAEWSSMKSPARLISRWVAVIVILVGFLIGMEALDAQWTSSFAESILAYIPNLLGAAFVLLVGAVIARFLARSVLIGAVNMNLQYARLLSAGVKWLVMVLAVAMALYHLRIATGIVELGFGILFGGIVFALALAVGLGSKDLVTKSLERDVKKASTETAEDPLRHL